MAESQRNEEIVARSIERATNRFDHYFRFAEISAYLSKLAAEHPNLMTVESAGKSFEDRDLWLVKISSTGFDGSKPVIFMDSNIHSREWIAVMSTLNLIHELVEHSQNNTDMLAVDWMIMPMVNPDGYEYSHTANRLWRKTRSTNEGSGCFGTDPNRNFAYKWDVAISVSNDPCSDLFRGPRPEVEKEVVIISNLLRANAQSIKMYITVHSHGNYLLYPFGYDYNIPNVNTAKLQELGDRAAAAIEARYSRHYTVGNSAHALYPASGASDDFAAGEAGIAYAYTVELTGGGSVGFDLPPTDIQLVSDEILVGYRIFAAEISKL